MTIAEYTTACLKFAEDSRSWSELPENLWYTTGDAEPWRETCDNAHGGIDVSWAFRKTPEAIEKKAPQRFLDEVSAYIRVAIDDGWDKDQLEWLYELVEG